MMNKSKIIQELINSEKLYKKASGIKGSASTIAFYLLILALLSILYTFTGIGTSFSIRTLAKISPLYFITIILPLIVIPAAIILFFVGRNADRQAIKHGQKILEANRILLDTIQVCQVKLGNATTTCFLAYETTDDTIRFISELLSTVNNNQQLEEQIKKELLINQLTSLQELLNDYPERDKLHLYTSFSRKQANATIINLQAELPTDKYIPLQLPQYIIQE